jgi:hypothetical protein
LTACIDADRYTVTLKITNYVKNFLNTGFVLSEGIFTVFFLLLSDLPDLPDFPDFPDFPE